MHSYLKKYPHGPSVVLSKPYSTMGHSFITLRQFPLTDTSPINCKVYIKYKISKEGKDMLHYMPKYYMYQLYKANEIGSISAKSVEQSMYYHLQSLAKLVEYVVYGRGR
jgi:hypothetical protein